MTMKRIAAALLTALALCANAAEQRTRVKAGADGRFELFFDPKTKIDGLNPAQTTRFRKNVDAVLDYMRGLEAVNQPPAPLCMRLSSWLEMFTRDGMAQAIIDAHYPISFDRGACHVMTGAGVTLRLNSDTLIFQQNFRKTDADGKETFLLPIESQQGGVVTFKGKMRALIVGKDLPWRPVARKRYLDQEVATRAKALASSEKYHQLQRETDMREKGALRRRTEEDAKYLQRDRDRLDKLRADLAASTGAAAAQPVCLDINSNPSYGECAPGNVLMERNPDYWNRTAPDKLQLIVIETPAINLMQESKEKFAMRMRVYDSIDTAKLLSMMDR